MGTSLVEELDPQSCAPGREPSAVKLSGFSFAGKQQSSLEELLRSLESVYCGSIGFEISHITSSEERRWLRARIEGTRATASAERRREIFTELLHADLLESELHKRYVGAKRFSLEGNDTLMPLLNEAIVAAAKSGVHEVVIGMAHRGRLNVLMNTLKKPLELLFSEFEDKTLASVVGAGDVKYHLGWEHDFTRDGRTVALSLAPNPSHLEFVNPVVEGIARAKQDRLYGYDRRSVMPIVMHGDAAVAGQGIVFETLNYSRLDGYSTGGSLHIVINNQIGFTTTPDESRSTRYCTDLAKGLDVPVFHVNAEDPEAACWIARLAVEYRDAFGKDVFIDLIGHRKHGHNEGDDPTFTQPLTYAEVKTKEPIWRKYGAQLESAGVVTKEFVDEALSSYKRLFAEAGERVVQRQASDAAPRPGVGSDDLRVVTRVTKDSLMAIAERLVAYPSDFSPHPKLAKILEKRVETVKAGEGIEWGVAEALAFGSLVKDGVGVRLSGQDCRRGTFSQRHLVLDDFERGTSWSPLEGLAAEVANGATFEVHNSSLSEAAVIGFEFGFSATDRKSLVMWEAQFGDFANGGQVLIDQFICSSETKWGQLSGVTLMLPHGFEGQGPEHSSARLERYLQLCAQDNMTVCYPSTAAQHFHMLRRQGLTETKRPLVVMTPKSLLRLPAAMSSMSDFASIDFQELLADPMPSAGSSENLVLMSGKVYHDLSAALKDGSLPVRMARVEQLYPFPSEAIAKLVTETKAKNVFWVQEEPQNQGAWSFASPRLLEATGIQPRYIGRPEAAATATGSGKYHAIEQKAIIEQLRSAVSKSK
jgi:2-oxoglutarate dehydrogenase E1 component